VNVLEYACRNDDAGPRHNAQSVMRLTSNVIAGSNLSASQRLALLQELEEAWRKAGLT
jgi:hypothetical protein